MPEDKTKKKLKATTDTEKYVSHEYEDWVKFCDSESLRLVYETLRYKYEGVDEGFCDSVRLTIFNDLLRRYRREVIAHA